jgi:hypothetical protein
MAIAKLTGQGLTAIALSVGLLWGCIIGERLIVQHANVETTRTLRELRLLRQQRDSAPVAVPVRAIPRPVKPALG